MFQNFFEIIVNECLKAKETLSTQFDTSVENVLIKEFINLSIKLYEKINKLDKHCKTLDNTYELESNLFFCKNNIIPAMKDLREVSDNIEINISKEF